MVRRSFFGRSFGLDSQSKTSNIAATLICNSDMNISSTLLFINEFLLATELFINCTFRKIIKNTLIFLYELWYPGNILPKIMVIYFCSFYGIILAVNEMV